jgi:hypothetical protein
MLDFTLARFQYGFLEPTPEVIEHVTSLPRQVRIAKEWLPDSNRILDPLGLPLLSRRRDWTDTSEKVQLAFATPDVYEVSDKN